MTSTGTIYDGLRALSCNCTLKPSPELSHTSRNTTFMTWNLLHLARILKFENPEYR